MERRPPRTGTAIILQTLYFEIRLKYESTFQFAFQYFDSPA
jgi:hypothetical protein